MIETLFQGAALFLLANLVAGGWRIHSGPEAADRIQALLLFGTSLVAVLLLLAYAGDREALIDVGLVMAMLASWVTITFVLKPPATEHKRDL